MSDEKARCPSIDGSPDGGSGQGARRQRADDRAHGGYMAARPGETREQLLARALIVADEAMREKDARIAELEPKALFADAVAASDGTCLVGELAKMMRQNGVEVGQNRLFAWLREDGYLGRSGSNRNVPTQRAMEQGLFRIKETAVTHSDGHVTVSRTPKVTGKGRGSSWGATMCLGLTLRPIAHPL